MTVRLPIGEACTEKGDVLTVVAGVDQTPTSAVVVARAIEQAQWRNTGLHVVYVTHLPLVYTDAVVDWDEVKEAQRNNVWTQLGAFLEPADVAIQRIDRDGYPPDSLVAYANDVGASLLVVGTRGRGDLASLVLGSTSHSAIHLASCDVLVVKASSHE